MNRSIRCGKVVSVFMAGVAVALWVGIAQATTYTWDGSSANWSASNTGWVGGPYPANGASTTTAAVFDATGFVQPSPTVSNGVEANKLTFNYSGYTILSLIHI